jgi:hypothetical protein
MNIIEELDRWDSIIKEAEAKVDLLNDERVKWCRENASLIKSFLPKKNIMYQIISFPNNYMYKDLDVSDGYYFKPKNTRFDPQNLFRFRGKSYPSVKGEVYDCNYKKLDIYDPEICITQLKEIDESVNYRDKNTFIYVMIDKNTGYYKIGRSKKPKARESTLQSEKPTIEMLFYKEGKNSHEKILHDKFQGKRVRGEWFDLSGSDLESIKQQLNYHD